MIFGYAYKIEIGLLIEKNVICVFGIDILKFEPKRCCNGIKLHSKENHASDDCANSTFSSTSCKLKESKSQT